MGIIEGDAFSYKPDMFACELDVLDECSHHWLTLGIPVHHMMTETCTNARKKHFERPHCPRHFNFPLGHG